MSIVLVLRGPSGVGKSTMSEHIKNRLGSSWVSIDVDKFKHYIPLNSDKSNRAERTQIAHEVGRFFAKQAHDKGYDIVLEEMFRQSHYDDLIEFLDDNQMRYVTVFLSASVDQVLRRSRDRSKLVPEEETRRLYEEVVPYEGDFVIDTTNYSSDQVADLVIERLAAEGRAGSVVLESDSR